ncbi:MAG: pilus (MSHA type) biogenesis protein MshL [Magnetococcales bacterium]|nr:pilus (MSHA type) biogenesis protein MshL [Magnetococcales bacterium]
MDRLEPMQNQESSGARRQSAARMARRAGLIVLGCLLLAACEHQSRIKQSRDHFLQPTNPEVEISTGPAPKKEGTPLAALQDPATPEEVYTITVTDMPVRDLLFALARDANKNIDVYPGIQGRVTLSAIDQPLSKILDRVSRQVAIRYEIQDKTIVVTPDLPYLKVYQVDYLGVERDLVSTNKISTHLSTTKGNPLSNPLSGSDNNQSNSTLTTASTSKFWKSITQNIQAILGADAGIEYQSGPEPAAIPAGAIGAGGLGGVAGMGGVGGLPGAAAGLPPGGGLGAAPAQAPAKGLENKPNRAGLVSVNTEAGVMSIIATSLQHDRIQEYLDSVLENVHRQVLIESTVVEVELSDRFQEGVDWNVIFNRSSGLSLKSAFSKSEEVLKAASSGASGVLNYFTLGQTGNQDTSATGPVNATIKLLENFGNAKILSSPKIMALNNQPAVLKVVKNSVFFTLKSSTGTRDTSNNGTNTSGTVATQPVFDTEIHTVPVGLVMTVTPQISKEGIVSLNVRPTISRISSLKPDPNPALVADNLQTGLKTDITNYIPEIEVKEMETMMRVHSGQVAVMGGLMQDQIKSSTEGLPILSRLSGGMGALFGHRDDGVSKSELVIFLRPVVMTHGKPRETTTAERARDLVPQPAMQAAPNTQAAPALMAPPPPSQPVKAATTPENDAKPAARGETKKAITNSSVQHAQETKPAAPAENPSQPAAPQEQAPAPTVPQAAAPVAPQPAVAELPSAPPPAPAPAPAPAAAVPATGSAANAMSVGSSYLDFTAPAGQGAATGSGALFPSASPPTPAFPVRDPAPVPEGMPSVGREAALGRPVDGRL